MNKMDVIGDTCKDRRIDYGLIDRINRQYEKEGKKAELKAKLAKKKITQKKEKEKEEKNPATDIKYIKTPDELREIKNNYLLQKGVYMIDFEIYVPNGCGLILEPGVGLYFTKNAGITCEGRFEAKGKSGLEVLLTAQDKSEGWKNLYLGGGAEAILDYVCFSYGKGRENKKGHLSGGAILLKARNILKPSITINNSDFENNSARYGGVIYNMRGDIRIGKNNRFENNSAEMYGGVIYNMRGNIRIGNNNRFENNPAEMYGGVIYNNQGNITIKNDNEFKNNYGRYNGGAIFNHIGEITINKDNKFENNSASFSGGAIRNYEGKLKIDKSKNIFETNTPDDIYED